MVISAICDFCGRYVNYKLCHCKILSDIRFEMYDEEINHLQIGVKF